MSTDPTEAASPTKLALLVMAGLPRPQPQEHKRGTLPEIINVLIKMKNKGKSDYTIESTDKRLTMLSNHADLNDPEAVEQFIAQLKTTEGYKATLCTAYQKYCTYYKIEWEQPTYTGQSKIFKLPRKEQILQIIASATKGDLPLKLSISYECGLRPVEVTGEHGLTPENIDLTNKTITPNTAKHGLPRMLPISTNLRDQIQAFIIKKKLNNKDRLFNQTPRNYSKVYRTLRNRVARNLNDPSIRQIRLYDLRHYFGTMLYDKTKNLGFTAEQMGHRNWANTQIYVKILAILNLNEEEFHCAVARTPEEICKLIETGFQYVTEMDGLKFFKKRK